MSDLFGSLSYPILQKIGLALLHSLWQLTLIAITVVLIIRIGSMFKLFRRANSRYFVQCCGLLLMLLAPIATVMVLESPALENSKPPVAKKDLAEPDKFLQVWNSDSKFERNAKFNGFAPINIPHNRPALPAPPTRIESTNEHLHANVGLIAVAWCWLIGTIAMFVHSFCQWKGARRLSFAASNNPPSYILSLHQSLVTKLGISRNISVRLSKFVDVPTLIGWLKPIILLPPAMVSGLSARELELILLHELIHIERHDYLVNVMQTGIESLLFYHPCVWWLSRQIRIEREFAADEQVVRLSQDQATYVKALLQLEQFRNSTGAKSTAVLAATDGSLLLRVKKIVATGDQLKRETESVNEASAKRVRETNHPITFSTRVPLTLIALTILFACTFLLASSFLPTTEKIESKPMPRYSDNFTRMKRPDLSFGYGDADINNLHPWQAPFGFASREIDYDDGWELWCATADGKADVVKRLIEKDSRLKDLAFRYHCPLDLAVYGGHTQCVQILLDADTELTEKWGWYGWKRMLGIAKEMGHDEIHDLMLRRIENKFNYHPDIQLMVQALCDQDIDAMKHLLDEDPERVNIADEDGNTALHWAAFSRQLPMINLLVERGADPSRRNGAHAMPYQVKMWTSHKKELIRGLDDWSHVNAARDRLLELGAEVDFHTAVGRGDLERVRKMLAKDKSLVHHMPGHLGSPLNAAVGNLEMLQLLLDHDADPNMTEHTAPFGCALYTAVSQNKYASAKLLLENGAEPMQYSDSSGDTLFAANLWIKDEADRKRMIDLLNEHSGKEHTVIPQRNDKPEHEIAAAAVREVLARDTVTDWQVGHLLEVILLYRDADLLEAYIERLGDRTQPHLVGTNARRYEGRLFELLTEQGAKVKPVDTSVMWMGRTVLHANDDPSLVADFVAAGGNINSVNIERQRTALSNAAASGKIEMVRELLKHGADPNLPAQLKPNQPLNLAKEKGHEEVVQILLDQEAHSLSQSKPESQTTHVSTFSVGSTSVGSDLPHPNPELWNAAHAGDLDKVKELIEAGADPNSVDSNGSGTLLNFHPEVTKYLLEQGANPDLQRNENILPVLVGISGFNTECLKLMLDAGANPNIASDHNGETALHHAVCGDHLEQVKALLDAGADPNKRTLTGKTTYMLWRDARCRNEAPLHRAAAYGTPEVIQLLLDNGADPTRKDANKDTPLSWASWHHRDKSIIDMLAYEGSGVGPDYPLTDWKPDGDSVSGKAPAVGDLSGKALAAGGATKDSEPAAKASRITNPQPRNDELVAAALAGDLDQVKKLIEGGADPNSVDANGMGPLLNFHPEVTAYLLSKGADPDIQRNENILPVISGVCSNIECVRLMLDTGANVNRASDHNGETVLHFAASGHNIELLEMVLAAGAKPNARTIPGMRTYAMWRDVRVRGETPLHRAAAWGSEEAITMLLDAGADPNIRDANGDSPLSWASWYMRDWAIIDLLQNAMTENKKDADVLETQSHGDHRDHSSSLLSASSASPRFKDLAKKGDFEKLHELWQTGQRFDLGEVFERAVTDFRSVKRKKGHQQILEFCIDQGLDPLARVDWMKQPAICTAAMFGNVALIEHVAEGVGLPEDPFVRASVGDVEFFKALAESKGEDRKKEIRELRDENGFSLLHYATSSGLGRTNDEYKSKLESTCQFLIESGVATDLAIDNEISLTPALFCAWFGGNPKIMQSLLDAGQIKVNELHQTVEFAFEPHQRSGDPHESVANVILKNGFDINSIYPAQKRTLLHGSSNRGSIKAVTWLLKNGADPNKLDDQGRTSLHVAAIRNTHASVVKLLVDHGADIGVVDNEGNTASDLAKSKGRDKVLSFFDDLTQVRSTDLHQAGRKLETIPSEGGTTNSTVSGKALAAGDIEDSTEPAASASRLTSEVSTSISKTVTNMNLLSPDHPFIVAVREVNLPRVKELVTEDNSFVNAQVLGDISLTGKVWKDGKHVEVSDDASEHAGALHFAAFHGHDDLAKTLIDLGADVDAAAYFGEKEATAVTLAAWEGNKDTLEVILEAMSGKALASGESRSSQLQPALFTALVHLSKEKADLLIEHGAEHDIFTAAMAGDGETLTKLIHADPNSVNRKHPEYDRTPLEQALKVGQTEMAEILAKQGAEVSTSSAAAMGCLEEVKAFLEQDSDAATRPFGSYPLLIWAIHGQQVKIVEFLLKHGSDPNGGDRWEYTPLSHIANVKGETGADIVGLLLAAGADPKMESRGKTPIEWALEKKNKHVHHGLVRHIENDVEVSEFEMKFWKAVQDGDLETVKNCLADDSALASKRFPTHNELFYLTDGFPLFVATRSGHWEIAQLLLDYGADPDAKRDLEESRVLGIGNNHRELGMPLHYAAAVHQKYSFANTLLDRGATASGHPYCDQSTIERMFYQACEADVPEAVVRRGFARFLPDQQELESQSVTALVGDDATESVKLFARMVDLDSQPPFSGLVRNGFDDLLIEIVKHSHDKDGTPHDHPQGNVFNNIFGSARWSGYPKLLRRLMELPNYQYSYGYTLETIEIAIGSHNRDGDYAAYREIILMQLEAIKANGDLKKAQKDPNFQPFYKIGKSFTWHSNYGYRAEIAQPECYIDLAELFVSWGFEGIECLNRETNHSPLSIAVQRGHHPGKATYIRWLLERGAELRQSDPDEVNPIAIAKAKGLDEITELLESYRG